VAAKGKASEGCEPERQVLTAVESFMNSNNLAVDLKTKQTNSSKTAGVQSPAAVLNKVSAA